MGAAYWLDEIFQAAEGGADAVEPKEAFQGGQNLQHVQHTFLTRWWQLKYFWKSHPENWGNDPIWLAHIFQMGWFNHQLVEYFFFPSFHFFGDKMWSNVRQLVTFCSWTNLNWVVVSNIFYFHPYLGKWSNLTNIFQMGWFNHQLVNLESTSWSSWSFT